MKKLTALLLTVYVCLSVGVVFAACGETEHSHTFKTEWSKDDATHWHACEGKDCSEIADKGEHSWNNGEITTPATDDADGVKTFTCTVCGQTKTQTFQLRTTITKEEWNAHYSIDNFTVETKTLNESSGGYITYGFAQYTENLVYANTDGQKIYIVRKNDLWYFGTASETEKVVTLEHYDLEGMNTIGSIFSDDATSFSNFYDSFTYDETKKCYCYSDNYEYYFENGLLVKLTYLVGIRMEFSNIGTTTITDLPEFIFPND